LESANTAIVRFVVTSPSLLVRGLLMVGRSDTVVGFKDDRIHMGSIRRIPFI
jgi:hypothetical protein